MSGNGIDAGMQGPQTDMVAGMAAVDACMAAVGFLCRERAEMRERADAGEMSYIEVKELCDMAHDFRVKALDAIKAYKANRTQWMAQDHIKLSYRIVTIDIEHAHVADLVRVYKMINADFHYCYKHYIAALTGKPQSLMPKYVQSSIGRDVQDAVKRRAA